MAEINLAGVYVSRAKGHTYYYAWRPGKGEATKARLHAAPGSEAFVQELALKLQERKGAVKGSFHALIAEYKASDAWLKDISQGTRDNWILYLDDIQVRWGKMPLAAFERPKIRKMITKWRDDIRKKREGTDRRGRKVMLGGDRAADMARQVVSRVLSFGVAMGDLTINAVDGIPCVYDSDRSSIIWDRPEIDQIKEESEVMWEAARLAELSGLRKGDLLRLSPKKHIGVLSIEIATGKSGAKRIAIIPLYGELREHVELILANWRRRMGPRARNLVPTRLLTSTTGLPWTSGGFDSSWNSAKKEIGVDKHFHDLRGNGATNLYRQANMSIREIAEIMAWSEEDVEEMINRYVKKDEILRDRIRRIDEARRQ